MSEINLDLAENLPGKETERKSPRGDLYWIFTAITDTIAWSILPPHVFQKMFRQDLLVASLFRNFLLAKRLMKGMRCNPQSNPPLPDCSSHPLWQVWDFALESGLLQTAAEMKGILRNEPQMSPWYVDVGVVAGGSGSSAYIDRASALVGSGNNAANNGFNSISAPFFADMLTAFEIWLDFGGGARPGDATGDEEGESFDQASHFPLYLPIILQVLSLNVHLSIICNLFVWNSNTDFVVANLSCSCVKFVVEVYFKRILGRELLSVGWHLSIYHQAVTSRQYGNKTIAGGDMDIYYCL